MQVGRDGRKHWARFMLTGQARDPAQAILGFCELVRRLPNAGRAVWKAASPKEFDIGLQAGLESRAAEWVLDARVIAAVRAVGARIRLTVYSPLPLLEEEEQRVRRRAGIKAVASAGNRIARVSVTAEWINVYLIDGLMISVPIKSSWLLSNATRAQRANWQLIGNGQRVYWPDIDEDLSVHALLEGIPVRAPGDEHTAAQSTADQPPVPPSRAHKKAKAKGRRRTAARG